MQMKLKHLLSCMGLGATLVLTSCMSEDPGFDFGAETSKVYGSLNLESLTVNSEFDPLTRAVSEDAYRNVSNYNIRVVDTKSGTDVLNCAYSSLADNMPLPLEIGSYTIIASYGAEHAFSRDEFLVTGEQTVTINAKAEQNVSVSCAPTCGKLTVEFDPTMSTYFDAYSVTYSGTQAMGVQTCTWEKADTAPWYVAIGANGENVNYKIHLTAKADYLPEGQTSKTAEIPGTILLKRNKAHKLTIAPNYKPSTEGGISLTITIDESTNDKEITWEVPVTWI